DTYRAFNNLDSPITKYLQQPLYFEVKLRSTNPEVSLELMSCWATLENDRKSLPRWDIIIDGCPSPKDPFPVKFHPVFPDGRVQYPSHVKRFEVPMFAFADDKENLKS
ncbi:hypothetical protein FQN60_015653, partial [Etheostoma spectabile]